MNKTIQILCFGDSITLGVGDSLGGWVDRLKVKLVSHFSAEPMIQLYIYNLGIGSETTDGLLSRFTGEVNARCFRQDKAIIFFAYGMNDVAIHKNKNIVPEEYFYRNLTSCIKLALTAGHQIFLLTIPPVTDAIDGKKNIYDKQVRNCDIDRFNTLLHAIAVEFKCEMIDVAKLFNRRNEFELHTKDGVHPNEIAQQQISERIYSCLLLALNE